MTIAPAGRGVEAAQVWLQDSAAPASSAESLAASSPTTGEHHVEACRAALWVKMQVDAAPLLTQEQAHQIKQLIGGIPNALQAGPASQRPISNGVDSPLEEVVG